jgi:hypothetical protein
MMTTVAFRLGLLAMVSIALGAGVSSWAQDKCTACLNQQTSECVRRVGTPAPAEAGKPAPVEASGVSACPNSARASCKASGACAN